MTCWADPEWQGALPQLYAQHISHKCDLEGDNAHMAKERVGDGASKSMGIHPTVLVHCRISNLTIYLRQLMYLFSYL